MEQDLGIGHFLAQADGVGHALLAVLLAMSLAGWYLIIARMLSAARRARQQRRFQAVFDDARGLDDVERHLLRHGADEPFSRLAQRGLAAIQQFQARTEHRLIDAVSPQEFLTRALRRGIEQEAADLEHGQALLASVASAAPFVGLFGTVWGIYHALLAIGMSGQASLDKVAGPVGEALIMTALGLAVAIPAALAYNAIARANRLQLSALDGFAHDLFAFMSTGVRHGAPRPAPTGTTAAPLAVGEVV